jgi:putative SOS response-associated peptidase YedK
MCGRFNFSNQTDLKKKSSESVSPSFNFAPSQKILAINSNEDITALNWGYKPQWLKQGQIINAQRETLKTKPTFRGYLQCYVPINGWYEWLKEKNGKQPYYFHTENETVYIKSIVKEDSIILLTTKASDNIAHIHHRMPLIVKEPDFNIWNLNQVDLNVSYYPVSKKVNYALNDGKELIDKVI